MIIPMVSWNKKSISVLQEITEYLNKNLGELIRSLLNYFIDKNNLFINIKDYSLGFSSDCSLSSIPITNFQYKLAFVCDLGYYIDCMRNNKPYKSSEISTEKIYTYITAMIRYSLTNNFIISTRKLNYKEMYLCSLLKDIYRVN